MSTSTATATKNALFEGVDEVIDVLIDYVVPLAAGFIGLVSGVAVFGGINFFYTQFVNAGWTNAGWTPARTAAAISGGIVGALGLGIWRIGKSSHWLVEAIGKGIGAYLLGSAGGYLLFLASPKAGATNGLIDDFGLFIMSL